MADEKGFQTPKRKLVIEKYSFTDAKERYKRQIEEHAFNHSVEVLVPECSLENVYQTFQKASPSSDHYYLVQLPIHVFTEVEFINTFLKNGQFLALSWETHIDSGNCAAVLPSGKLVLSLDKDTYEQLGLTGKPSVFQKKQRFIVEVDLRAPFFIPGKKLYKRVQWCLKKRMQLAFKFLMTWTNEGHASIDKLRSYFKSHAGQMLRNVEDIQSFSKQQKVPVISFHGSGFTGDTTGEKNCRTCDCMSFFEWLGCVACGIDCSEASSDSFVSTLHCPEPTYDIKELIKCRWTGMITSCRILSLLQAVRNLVQSSNIAWVALTVWGFVDSPVAWKQNDHGHFLGGENLYTFVIFPGDEYWIYVATGSHDICS